MIKKLATCGELILYGLDGLMVHGRLDVEDDLRQSLHHHIHVACWHQAHSIYVLQCNLLIHIFSIGQLLLIVAVGMFLLSGIHRLGSLRQLGLVRRWLTLEILLQRRLVQR